MSNIFRDLIKKVGSGSHTSQDLTREESALATKMMLTEEATPAQIGAFMIAHRIKRPTPGELAGMLDAYQDLGPGIDCHEDVVVFCHPYDGRSRTAPVSHITALILATAGIPVVMHGGNSMPTKYGITLIEIWQALGVDFAEFSLAQTEELLKKTGIGFVYLPQHFPLAQNLVTYREQIGKRPPFATLELMWSPCLKNVHRICGFVHPPTEERFRETFKLYGVSKFTAIKGLEGSCDLALSRTGIIGIGDHDSLERLLLNPRDYNFPTVDVPLQSKTQLIEQLQAILQGKSCELMPAAIWNGGFYLWHCGVCADLPSALTLAETMLTKGEVAAKLSEIVKQTLAIANVVTC